MLGNLSIAGIDLSITYGVYATDAAVYNMPSADVQTISILGRSGDLIIPRNRYSNIQVRYPCVMPVYNASRMNQLRAWLLKDVGYLRIEDSFDTEHFRLGRFVGNVAVSPAMDGTAMTFELVFDCKPQRWLIADTQHILGGSGSIEVLSQFPANPLIYVVPSSSSATSGIINIGSQRITIDGAFGGGLTIDSELKDVHKDATNLNSIVTFSTGEFPVLPVGTGTINVTYSGDIARLDIDANWWEL